MNCWRSRLVLGLVFFLAAQMHAMVTAGFGNNPVAMLGYHGSAGTIDLALLYCSPWLVSGRTCDDMQTLCLASIVVNFAGYLGYLAYAPPVLYDTAIAALCYAQYARLIVGGNNDDYARLLGIGMVRGADPRRPKLHFEKAQ